MDVQQQEKRLMAAAVFMSSVGLSDLVDDTTLFNADENYEALDIDNIKRFLMVDAVDARSWVADSVDELIALIADSGAPFRNATWIWDLDRYKTVLEMNVNL
jgi:hypothetical protein